MSNLLCLIDMGYKLINRYMYSYVGYYCILCDDKLNVTINDNMYVTIEVFYTTYNATKITFENSRDNNCIVFTNLWRTLDIYIYINFTLINAQDK